MKRFDSDLDALEPEQWSHVLAKPLPRKRLNGPTVAALVALRIYIVVAIPLVLLAFARALHP